MNLALSGSPTPFFSVILTTYNRAHLIVNAVRSVLAQSCKDCELLIVDDGSHDDTFDHLRPLILADPRIRYHFANNRGVSYARNIGAHISAGSFITFLDSDDEYLPEHLALRKMYLDSHPEVELLHGGCEIIGSPYVADRNDPSRQIPLSECVIGGTFFLRRSLVEQLHGFKPIGYSDDADFFDRALAANATIHKVDYPTYRYNRLEPDSLCNRIEQLHRS
jgi:glycosyltransferase involved in cell wall biosynthesis